MVSTLTTAVQGLAPAMLQIGAVGLAISVTCFSLYKGWHLIVAFNK